MSLAPYVEHCFRLRTLLCLVIVVLQVAQTLKPTSHGDLGLPVWTKSWWAGLAPIARLKRPGYQKSFTARYARSCALLITVEEILSGPTVVFFVAVFFLRVWVVSLYTWSSCTPWPPSWSIGSSILLFFIQKGNNVLVSQSPQRCRSKLGGLETVASSRMFTLLSAVRSLLCEGERRMVLSCRWPTVSLSSSQPKLLCGAVTATPLQTSLRISIFFCLHTLSDMWVFPHSASQWKFHTRPLDASRLPHASQGRFHRIVHERDRSVASR